MWVLRLTLTQLMWSAARELQRQAQAPSEGGESGECSAESVDLVSWYLCTTQPGCALSRCILVGSEIETDYFRNE